MDFLSVWLLKVCKVLSGVHVKSTVTLLPLHVLMLTCQGDCILLTYEGSFWAANHVMAICCCLCDFTTDGGMPQHPPCQLSGVLCSQVHLWHRIHPTLSLHPGTCTGSHQCSTLWTPCYSEWECLSCLWRHTRPAGKCDKNTWQTLQNPQKFYCPFNRSQQEDQALPEGIAPH